MRDDHQHLVIIANSFIRIQDNRYEAFYGVIR
jgi:hypothetical protein